MQQELEEEKAPENLSKKISTISLTGADKEGFDMFGKCVGFVKFNADVVDKATGKKVPGIVFAHGPAVAVLILLESDGNTFAMLTEQIMRPMRTHIHHHQMMRCNPF
ncbi:nudix hydrolase 14, chloroplastic-like isoform X4 [Camellia sinensis]|uniref:nudix hydrolase 14, chloroplastic-like isoform X4 n=1 Tax=Camellia sinensis TaxID=4442 RepID=UPI001035A0D1|nr:nudix hydrolase 14, chloroplastic-like isoform X4 [Camellia sinensis]